MTPSERRRRVGEALIGALGVAGEEKSSIAPTVIGALIGVVVGAGVALLLAPKAGGAVRREVAGAWARWRKQRSNGKGTESSGG